MGQGYSIHIVNLNGFDIKYTISNDNRQILLPLKTNDILTTDLIFNWTLSVYIFL